MSKTYEINVESASIRMSNARHKKRQIDRVSPNVKVQNAKGAGGRPCWPSHCIGGADNVQPLGRMLLRN